MDGGDWIEVEIVGLGSGGDGVAETPRGPVYVPYTAPGDRVRVRYKGKSLVAGERVADGPGRIAPVCSHFGQCGGCAVQHIAEADYAAWKRDLLVRALAQRGVACDVAPLVRVPPGTRRRVRLGARVAGGRVLLGFKERRSHRLVDLTACPVLTSAIAAILPALRGMLGDRLPPRGRAELSVTAIGPDLDIAVDTAIEPDLAARENLAEFAARQDLARLSWGGEILVQRRPVRLNVAGVEVDLPPDAFLQPTAEGEAYLRDSVVRILSGTGPVADLYAGCGTFALGLMLAGAAVHAVDVDGPQCAALRAAARRSEQADRLEVCARDLNRQPLAAKELNRFEGVVLDPPRAGAARQVQALAVSGPRRIAYVSCNPATFARDARTLVDGGYRLVSVVPVDQFPWSPHLELIGELIKD